MVTRPNVRRFVPRRGVALVAAASVAMCVAAAPPAAQQAPPAPTREDLAKDNKLFITLARHALKWDESDRALEDRRAAALCRDCRPRLLPLRDEGRAHPFQYRDARIRPDDRRIDADARVRRQGHQDSDQRSRPPGSRGGVRLFQKAVPSICTTPSVLRTPPDSSVQLGPRTPRQETFTTTAVMRMQNDGAVRGRPSSSAKISVCVLFSIHQPFSRRTCSWAVAVNRTWRGFNSSEALSGPLPHRSADRQPHRHPIDARPRAEPRGQHRRANLPDQVAEARFRCPRAGSSVRRRLSDLRERGL